MSLWTWISDKVTGYDSANAAKAEQADAILRQQNEQIYSNDPAKYAVYQQDYGTQGDLSTPVQRGQIGDAFNQGLQEGANNVKGAFDFTLSTIPAGVWVAAGVGLFLWAGGFQAIKGALAKT